MTILTAPARRSVPVDAAGARPAPHAAPAPPSPPPRLARAASLLLADLVGPLLRLLCRQLLYGSHGPRRRVGAGDEYLLFR